MGSSESTEQSSCFSYMVTVEPPQMQWKTFLKRECEELDGQCVWATQVLRQMKRIKKTPQHKYYRQVKEVDAQYRESVGEDKRERAMSYQSSILHGPQGDISSSNFRPTLELSKPNEPFPFKDSDVKDEKTRKVLFKRIKKSELFEDDLLDALATTSRPQTSKNLRKNCFDSKSYASYSLMSDSSTPSFVFQENRILKQQILEDPQAQQQIMQQINYFLQMTQILESHLTQPDHQLYQIMGAFTQSLTKNYGDPEPEQLVRYLYEIQQFSRVMEGCLELYYELNKEKNATTAYSVLLTDENLLNFIVTKVMEDKVLYGIFYKLLDAHSQAQISLTKGNIKALKGITVAQCQVPLKFQLTEASYQYLCEKNNQEALLDVKEMMPYDHAIRQLQKIRDKKSPSSKLKVIIKMSQQLMKCIKKFYQRYGFKFDGVIEADDLIPIQTYILVKSELFDIGIHIYMIEKLATNKLLQGTSGYYLTTILAATEYLQKLVQQQKTT